MRAQPPGRSVAGGLALLVCLAGPSAAQPTTPEDWTCQFCPFPSGPSSTWSLGSGYVSDASAKFGDYTGLDDDGLYAIGGGEARYWRDTGGYWQLFAADLGLESRSLVVDGGRPGAYRLTVDYDAIPHGYGPENARTPFRSNGATLSLPSAWVDAGSTPGMTALRESLRGVDAGTERDELGVGLAWLAGEALEYRAEYRRQARTGTQLLAGSFAASSAWLPAPIDDATDEVELGVSGAWARGTVDVAYLGSRFTNHASTVTWENPFTGLAPGADLGRLALAPDNTAHQLSISGSYRLGVSTHLSASLATGRLEQNDLFAALTVNPTIVPGLPRASLDGKVDTSRVSLDLVSQLADGLRLKVRYHRDERDNRTAQAVYDYVLTDLVPIGSRTNIPYSFERSGASVSAAYQLPHRLRLEAGLERDVHERSFQARSRSEEDSAWAKLAARGLDWLQATVGLTDRRRDGSDYRPVDLGGDPQNPLLRQYHLADRDQRIADLGVTLVPHERVNLQLRAERTRDEYPRAQLGLREGRSSYYSLDAGISLTGGFDAYAAFGRENVEFDQAGSQVFGEADWRATTEDTTDTRSLGFTKALLDERMRIQVEVTRSRSRGVTEVRAGLPGEDFPDFTTQLHALGVTLHYDISEALAVRIGYRNERYSSTDWQLDGVSLTTLTNILTVGAQSPRYNVDLLTLSFVYSPVQD